MADITLNSYLHQIYSAYEDYNGEKVASLLSIEDPHVLSTKLTGSNFENSVQDVLHSPLAEMVILHLNVLKKVTEQNMDEALVYQCQFGQLFCKILQGQKDENWMLPIMEKICHDLRRIALSAKNVEDSMVRSEDSAPTCLEKAADVIMAMFRICAADTRAQENDTKRWGMLSLVNQLFKIYFRINRLHLCKPLIRAIEAQNLKDRFPLNQIIVYKYYVGRKAMFDSEFTVAEECLTFAFQHASSKHSLENKRKILTYLVPVKMFLGWMPTKEALEKYDLTEFYEVADALKVGNIRRFNNALRKYERKFIVSGVYLILEKLRMILYRNLLKKTCLIYAKTQIPIAVMQAAMQWSGYEDIDLDETHCIVANLIFTGQIRGYISHQHQVLVVAKQNAFPKISLSES
ncbi:unnamed protein product [Allacma fusca]|uniref:PCI domain-containing protein 2 homolog n=1 Tax=Allacma fusca TaxID=39272 RepID=A0A8J2KWV7_9HEXA|nr:unnamed protein product [Allacma fusca]